MTDDKIVALPGVTIKPSDDPVADPGVIGMLEHALKVAKRGDIKWIGMAWVDGRNIAHSTSAPSLESGDAGALLTSAMGALSYLDKRVCADALDGAVGGEQPAGDEDDD